MGTNTVTVKLNGDEKGLVSAIGNATSSLAGFASSAAKVGLAAVGVQAGKSFVDALDQEVTGDIIAERLGLSDLEKSAFMSAAAGSFSDAWGESVEDVANTMGRLSRSSFGEGLGAEALADLSEQAMGIAGVFDVDVGQAIQSASQLVQDFGGEGSDALDSLRAGLAAMPQEIQDEIFEATNEYGKHFAALGFDANQMLGVLTEFGQDGVFGIDKAGDALKEFTIRATDGSTASVEALESLGLSAGDMANNLLAGGDTAEGSMRQIVEELLSIEDPMTQANTAIALFGTPLEDLGTDQIPAFLQTLSTMGDGFEVVEGSARASADAMGDNIKTRALSRYRKIQQSIADLMTTYALPAYIKVENFLIKHGPKIREVMSDVFDTLQDGAREAVKVFEKHWPTVQKLIGRLVDWVKDNWPGFRDTMIATFERIVEFVRTNWPQFRDTVLGAVTAVVDFVQEHWPRVKEIILTVVEEIVSLVQEHWPQVKQIILDAVGAIRAGVERFVTIAIGLWERFGDNILTFVERVWPIIEKQIGATLDVIQGIFRTFKALFEGDWSAMWDGIKQIFSGVWEGIKNQLELFVAEARLIIGILWESIKEAIPLAWRGIQAAVQAGFLGILDWFTDMHIVMYQTAIALFGQVTDAVGFALNLAWEKVKEIFGSIWDWIADQATSLYDTVKAVFDEVTNAIRDALAFVEGIIQTYVIDPVERAIGKVVDLINLIPFVDIGGGSGADSSTGIAAGGLAGLAVGSSGVTTPDGATSGGGGPDNSALLDAVAGNVGPRSLPSFGPGGNGPGGGISIGVMNVPATSSIDQELNNFLALNGVS